MSCEHYSGTIHRIAHHFANKYELPPDVREDAIQASWLAVLLRYKDWDPARGQFAAWAYNLIHYAVHDTLRGWRGNPNTRALRNAPTVMEYDFPEGAHAPDPTVRIEALQVLSLFPPVTVDTLELAYQHWIEEETLENAGAAAGVSRSGACRRINGLRNRILQRVG